MGPSSTPFSKGWEDGEITIDGKGFSADAVRYVGAEWVIVQDEWDAVIGVERDLRI